VGVRTEHEDDRTTTIYLTLETTGLSQLTRVLTKLESVRGVIAVARQVDSRRTSGAL
jgi:hypothetical protein